MRTNHCVLAVVLLAAAPLAGTLASTFTVQLTGSISSKSGTIPSPFASIQVGHTFTVTYVIDSAASDSMPADAMVGRYACSAYRLIVSGAGIDFTPPGATYVDVWNGQLGACPDCLRDTYWSVADLIPGYPGFDSAEITTRLNNDAGTVFANDVQPTALDIAQFPNGKTLSLRFERFSPPSSSGSISGNITAVSVAAQNNGACCNRWTGNCSVETPTTCSNLGLRFDGVGVACSPIRCRPCPADFNGSANISVQDIFDFLAAYFTGCP